MDSLVQSTLLGGPMDGAGVRAFRDTLAIRAAADVVPFGLVDGSVRVVRWPKPGDALFVYRRDGESGRYVFAMMKSEPAPVGCKTCAAWKPTPSSAATVTCRDCGRVV